MLKALWESAKGLATDVGFYFTLGNAILLTNPYTVGAAIMIGAMKASEGFLPKEPDTIKNKWARLLVKGIKDPNVSLCIAGAALIPVAIASTLAIPFAAGAAAIVTSPAFFQAAAATGFIAFDLMKPAENIGLLKPFKNKSWGRVANIAIKPETWSTIGLMAVAVMTGPLGALLWPAIGAGGAMTIINSQKEKYSNAGSPKLWMAGACLTNAGIGAASGNIGPAIANIAFCWAYTRAETFEKESFLYKSVRFVKGLNPFAKNKTKAQSKPKGPTPSLAPNPHVNNRENTATIKAEPQQPSGLLTLFAAKSKKQETTKPPIKPASLRRYKKRRERYDRRI